MTRRLVVTYFTITAFALASLAIPLGVTFAHREKDRLIFAIERDADAMATTVQSAVAQGKTPPKTAIQTYASRTGGHVIVVDNRGVALLDTEYPNGPARDYSTRPEIMQALAGERVDGTRRSSTLNTSLIYAAVPVSGGGDVGIQGAVRITYPSATLEARVRHTWGQLALLCLLVLCVVMAVGWALARGVTRPVRRLEDAANRVARGELATRVPEQRGPPEIQHLELAFNRMASEIARLVEAQQQFVADASHQLRTPLTALRLRLENLDTRVDAGDRPTVEALIADVTRLSRLVDGLLVLARDEAAALPRTTIDIAAVARERGEAWSDVAADRGVRLIVDAPGEAWASVAAGAVEQIVDNLIDNALSVSRTGRHDHRPREDRAPPSRASRARPRCADSIREDRDRAFDRFWRAPDAASGGSGLGLAIVRRLAEASGGTARLDEGPGGGIDAVVTLPMTQAASASAPVSAT